jgi:hypothetical protein
MISRSNRPPTNLRFSDRNPTQFILNREIYGDLRFLSCIEIHVLLPCSKGKMTRCNRPSINLRYWDRNSVQFILNREITLDLRSSFWTEIQMLLPCFKASMTSSLMHSINLGFWDLNSDQIMLNREISVDLRFVIWIQGYVHKICHPTSRFPGTLIFILLDESCYLTISLVIEISPAGG